MQYVVLLFDGIIFFYKRCVLDDEGLINMTSMTTWNYRAPYIQSTVDTDQQQLWVVTYPTASKMWLPAASGHHDGQSAVSGALIMQFDKDLQLMQSIKPNISLFDFQYSVEQQLIFGIAVASQYDNNVMALFGSIAFHCFYLTSTTFSLLLSGQIWPYVF